VRGNCHFNFAFKLCSTLNQPTATSIIIAVVVMIVLMEPADHTC